MPAAASREDGMWAVPGQQRATAALRGAVARGEVGHAWAFLGPARVGQQAAARALAAALNCPRPRSPGEPCGTCDVCQRCARGTFTSYREFIPAGAMHRVDDVRDEWLRAASRTASEGTWKVLRVCDADRMNETAANAFLKALEEPPERTVWVLDLADPDELPDTILSRCRALAFAAWTPADLQAEARRLGIEDLTDRELAVRVAGGSPAGLERLASGGLDDLRAHRDIPRRLREEGPGFALVAARAIVDEVKRGVRALEDEDKKAVADLADHYGDAVPRDLVKQMEDRKTRRVREKRTLIVQAALDDIVAWYRDCLLVGAGGDPADALNIDAPDALRVEAEALGATGILIAVDLLLATREALERNLQQTLALEALFIQLSAIVLAGASARS